MRMFWIDVKLLSAHSYSYFPNADAAEWISFEVAKIWSKSEVDFLQSCKIWSKPGWISFKVANIWSKPEWVSLKVAKIWSKSEWISFKVANIWSKLSGFPSKLQRFDQNPSRDWLNQLLETSLLSKWFGAKNTFLSKCAAALYGSHVAH